MSSPNLCYWTIAQTGMVVPKAEGMPGTTKTKSVEAFARAMGRRCYTLIGSLREPADIGGYRLLGPWDDGRDHRRQRRLRLP